MSADDIQTVFGAAGFLALSIKLTDSLGAFIENVRSSGTDVSRLTLKFDQLTLQLRSYQKVLFDPAKFQFLNKKALFEVLPEKEKETISNMIHELPLLLYEYWAIAKRYHTTIKNKPNKSSDIFVIDFTEEELKILFDQGQIPEKRPLAALAPSKSFWWAARKKNEVEFLLSQFQDWLMRIKNCLTSCWFPLTMFEHYSSMTAMEKDVDCTSVGISHDAGLRKLLLEDAILPEDSELKYSTAVPLESLGGSLRGIVEVAKGDSVLVELLPFKLNKTGFIDEKLKKRFCEIVSLMRRQNDAEFRVLKCRGYLESQVYDTKSPLPRNSFALVTEPPLGRTPVSRSLFEMLRKTERHQRPSLDDRLNLAKMLSRCISLYHSVGWIHRSIRSNNIIFFWPEDRSKEDPKWTEIILEPYFCGFEASRLADDYSHPTHAMNGFDTNVYRHPARWGTPRLYFNNLHDIYGKRPKVQSIMPNN